MPAAAAPFVDVEDLDATGVLAAAEGLVRERRAREVREAELVLHWADLHAELPTREPDADALPGRPRLVRVGGMGTPRVVDLAVSELAVARDSHTLATRSLLADCLDLRHRLPQLYTVVREGGCDLWVARKVASMSRGLDLAAVGLVDRAVAAATDQSPGRLLGITEAKVWEADTDQARAQRDRERQQRMVAIGRSDEHGLRTIFARVTAGDAVWIDAMIERVADALHVRRDLVPGLAQDCGRDELRAVALGWLAHPDDVIALLDGHIAQAQAQDGPEDETPPTPAPEGPADPGPGPDPRGRGAHRSQFVLYLHLHQAAVRGAAGVARVEDLGPYLLEELADLIGHTRIRLVPVIDLNTGASVNAYEHPQSVRDRTHLRCAGDVFPHANTTTRTGDMDHPTPYDPTGPPGQTGDHNAAPLSRRHHRAKTHLGYHLDQTGPGEYSWRTPHGLHRTVDATGTHTLDPDEAWRRTHPGALDAALDHLESKFGGVQNDQ